MQIVALLSWYEEDPQWLDDMVHRLPLAGVDRLVALDGAYALYPGATAASAPVQKLALKAACDEVGIGVDVYTPTGVFKGNEVEKRSALFELAEEVTGPDDWYLVIDADELITDVPENFRDRLEQTDLDAGIVTFDEGRDPDRPPPSLAQRKDQQAVRILFRATRGIRVKGNHWTYVTPDGRRLWGQNRRSLVPALDCTDLHILHRSDLRHEARRADQYAYYAIRDARGTERGYCFRCKSKAVKSMPYRYEPSPEGLTADIVDVCTQHGRQVKQENDSTLRRHGIDPTTLRPLIGVAL